MLVLSRGVNESIVIGDSVEITIVSVKGDKVRVGIRAPKSVSVHRKEIYEEIQRANVAAAEAGGDAAARLGAIFGKGPAGGPDRSEPKAPSSGS